MKVPTDVICKVCKKVFCCAECRHKHEMKKHAIVARKPIALMTSNETSMEIYLFCPICERKPFVLIREIYDEMLEHIQKHHLPLNCSKCFKVYKKIDDLKEFSKCANPSVPCQIEEHLTFSIQTSHDSKATTTKASSKTTTSTQTSPMLNSRNNDVPSQGTPMLVERLIWNRNKVNEELLSEIFSSMNNGSSIHRSAVASRGKLVRSTSTPVHAELYVKPKEHTFNASSVQVSSIYNSGCYADHSPAVQSQGAIYGSSSPKHVLPENMNRLKMTGGRARVTAVTPLRQVMSKSIQKALAEHGRLPASTGVVSMPCTRRNAFDFIDGSSCISFNAASVGSPLDLRLSPALRRLHVDSDPVEAMDKQENNCLHTQKELILSSTQKLMTESIVITRMQHLAESSGSSISSIASNTTTNQSAESSASVKSLSSVYKTCNSIEIITATATRAEASDRMSAYVNEESNDELCPLKPLKPKENLNNEVTNDRNNNQTPITRIPGAAIITKKIIQFDSTPNFGMESERLSHSTIRSSPSRTTSPRKEIFFTPNSSPIRTLDVMFDQRREVFPKKLPGNLESRFVSPMRRPTIRSSDDPDDIEDSNNNLDDEVFLSTNMTTIDSSNKFVEQSKSQYHSSAETNGSGWSFGSLMNSIMQLPLRGTSWSKENAPDNGLNTRTLLKRCASIAGSLVRSKPLVDEKQLQSLKRKRTYTLDSQPSNVSSPDTTATKRYRIQGRRPIDRMRNNS